MSQPDLAGVPIIVFLQQMQKELQKLTRGNRLRIGIYDEDQDQLMLGGPLLNEPTNLTVRFPNREPHQSDSVMITVNVPEGRLEAMHRYAGREVRNFGLDDPQVLDSLAAWLVQINQRMRGTR